LLWSGFHGFPKWAINRPAYVSMFSLSFGKNIVKMSIEFEKKFTGSEKLRVHKLSPDSNKCSQFK
jgi:hypothetical protein